jgi:hypothetical protein
MPLVVPGLYAVLFSAGGRSWLEKGLGVEYVAKVAAVYEEGLDFQTRLLIGPAIAALESKSWYGLGNGRALDAVLIGRDNPAALRIAEAACAYFVEAAEVLTCEERHSSLSAAEIAQQLLPRFRLRLDRPDFDIDADPAAQQQPPTVPKPAPEAASVAAVVAEREAGENRVAAAATPTKHRPESKPVSSAGAVARPTPPAPLHQAADGASTPAFPDSTSVALCVVRGIAGCAPPLTFTFAALAGCCLLELAESACPGHVLRAGPRAVSGALTAITGDTVVQDLAAPLSSFGVTPGSTVYLLTDGVEEHGKARELFRVRSQIDRIVHDLRMTEAGFHRRDTNAGLRRLGERLTQLLIRADAVDDLVPPLRHLRRQTCADAACAEQMLDKLVPKTKFSAQSLTD